MIFLLFLTNMASTVVTIPSIEQLNELPKEEFFKTVNTLFETAPPLANGLVKHIPFKSYEQLIDTSEKLINEMSLDEKIQVINAHPRIGTNPANEKLSAFSYKEQGLDKEREQEKEKIEKTYGELRELNEKYENKFGFKFVVFVNGRPKVRHVLCLSDNIGPNRTCVKRSLVS
jgi:2-oxo-4-hydroxy-4-carboxy--5-ureidoimidazoline (OHCU) decarboxylase